MIIAIWLAFLVVINFVFFDAENRIYHEKAQNELRDLSVTVSGQIPVILENDYCTRTNSSWMEYAKLKALSLALGDTEDIGEQEDFIREFVQAANVEGLAVYDRNAKVVFSSGNSAANNVDPAVVKAALDNRLSDPPDGSAGMAEEDRDKYLSARYLADESEETFSLSAGNGRWLIVTTRRETDAERQILDYFDWTNVLSGITIGRTGFVLAVSEENGIVLSAPDHNWIGRSVDEMNIRIEDSKSSATITELLNTFRATDQILKIWIGETKYYANLLKEDHSLMLALFPENEIRENVSNAASILVILVILISGIIVLFAFFHIQDTQDFKRRPRGRFAWNSVLAGTMTSSACSAT